MARILVVEDDKSMNDILVGCLTDDNHEVSSAFSGPEAIELSKLNTYDLLITDVRLARSRYPAECQRLSL